MAQIKNKNSLFKINQQNLIDIRQTKEYSLFLKKLGWITVILKTKKYKNPIFVYVKKIPLLPFSIIKLLHCSWPLQLIKLKKTLKKYHPLWLKIYPFLIKNKNVKQNKKIDFKKDKHPLIPTKTLWLNLSKSKKKILLKMKAKTRYNVRLAQRKNLVTKIIIGQKINKQQLKKFYILWRKNKPFNWLFKPSFEELKSLINSFQNKCFFVFIYQNNHFKQLLAASLILTSKNMAFYWHNCSSLKGKKVFAPNLCLWQAIQESKKRKLKVFDFEGIYDPRFHRAFKHWQGFSQFKKGFGGQEVEFINPFLLKIAINLFLLGKAIERGKIYIKGSA